MRIQLQEERKKRKMTKKEVAEQLGVSMQFVYMLETNKKDGTLKTWEKIQQVFDIPDSKLWQYMKENA